MGNQNSAARSAEEERGIWLDSPGGRAIREQAEADWRAERRAEGLLPPLTVTFSQPTPPSDREDAPPLQASQENEGPIQLPPIRGGEDQPYERGRQTGVGPERDPLPAIWQMLPMTRTPSQRNPRLTVRNPDPSDEPANQVEYGSVDREQQQFSDGQGGDAAYDGDSDDTARPHSFRSGSPMQISEAMDMEYAADMQQYEIERDIQQRAAISEWLKENPPVKGDAINMDALKAHLNQDLDDDFVGGVHHGFAMMVTEGKQKEEKKEKGTVLFFTPEELEELVPQEHEQKLAPGPRPRPPRRLSVVNEDEDEELLQVLEISRLAHEEEQLRALGVKTEENLKIEMSVEDERPDYDKMVDIGKAALYIVNNKTLDPLPLSNSPRVADRPLLYDPVRDCKGQSAAPASFKTAIQDREAERMKQKFGLEAEKNISTGTVPHADGPVGCLPMLTDDDLRKRRELTAERWRNPERRADDRKMKGTQDVHDQIFAEDCDDVMESVETPPIPSKSPARPAAKSTLDDTGSESPSKRKSVDSAIEIDQTVKEKDQPSGSRGPRKENDKKENRGRPQTPQYCRPLGGWLPASRSPSPDSGLTIDRGPPSKKRAKRLLSSSNDSDDTGTRRGSPRRRRDTVQEEPTEEPVVDETRAASAPPTNRTNLKMAWQHLEKRPSHLPRILQAFGRGLFMNNKKLKKLTLRSSREGAPPSTERKSLEQRDLPTATTGNVPIDPPNPTRHKKSSFSEDFSDGSEAAWMTTPRAPYVRRKYRRVYHRSVMERTCAVRDRAIRKGRYSVAAKAVFQRLEKQWMARDLHLDVLSRVETNWAADPTTTRNSRAAVKELSEEIVCLHRRFYDYEDTGSRMPSDGEHDNLERDRVQANFRNPIVFHNHYAIQRGPHTRTPDAQRTSNAERLGAARRARAADRGRSRAINGSSSEGAPTMGRDPPLLENEFPAASFGGPETRQDAAAGSAATTQATNVAERPHRAAPSQRHVVPPYDGDTQTMTAVQRHEFFARALGQLRESSGGLTMVEADNAGEVVVEEEAVEDGLEDMAPLTRVPTRRLSFRPSHEDRLSFRDSEENGGSEDKDNSDEHEEDDTDELAPLTRVPTRRRMSFELSDEDRLSFRPSDEDDDDEDDDNDAPEMFPLLNATPPGHRSFVPEHDGAYASDDEDDPEGVPQLIGGPVIPTIRISDADRQPPVETEYILRQDNTMLAPSGAPLPEDVAREVAERRQRMIERHDQRNQTITPDNVAEIDGALEFIRLQTLRWETGLDPRDDVRFDILADAHGNVRTQRREMVDGGNEDIAIPRRGSTPLHWQTLDHRIPQPRLLNRNRTVTQRPSRRSRNSSEPQPSSPHPPDRSRSRSGSPRKRARTKFGLDGADDYEPYIQDEDLLDESSDDNGIEESSPLGKFLSPLVAHAKYSRTRAKELSENIKEIQALQRLSRSRNKSTIWTTPEQRAMPSNTGMTRQAPSPSAAQQQQQQQNQQNQQQQQTNGLGGALSNGVPHAGHQTDINYLWGVVEELSDCLARNRAETAALVERVQGMREREARPPVAGPDPGDGSERQVNGDHGHGNAAAEIASLRSQLHNTQTALAQSQAETFSLANTNDDYVAFLHGTMDKLRSYAQGNSSATIAIHAHYNGLLEAEREANLQLRIEHGEWQKGLGRASEWARKALRERQEEVGGLQGRMREVAAENRVLRGLLGWKVDDDLSDDEVVQGQDRSHGQGQGLTPAVDGDVDVNASGTSAGVGAGVAKRTNAAGAGRGVNLG